MQRQRTAQEMITTASRMIASAGRHSAKDDPEMLTQLAALHTHVEAAIVTAIAGQRATGITWQSIGDALGVTRQAAIMRYGPAVAMQPINETEK